jgi:hypothetical protein
MKVLSNFDELEFIYLFLIKFSKGIFSILRLQKVIVLLIISGKQFFQVNI